MAAEHSFDPDLEWLDNAKRIGLVVAPTVLKELGLVPIRQTPLDTGAAEPLLDLDKDKPALRDPWTFVEQVLGWEARHVSGAPGGPAVPAELLVSLPEHATTLAPTWAVAAPRAGERRWQLLVRIEPSGVDADKRGALDGWEATPQQRFERLLRDTGVFAGVMITDDALRIVYAPKGETSGHLTFPLRPLATVAGRPMLGGLKLLLDRASLFTNAESHRLPALLSRSREAQASVSTALAEQVLGALHELLRGLDASDPALIRDLAENRPDHLYEGLLAVLMRLVFVLYAEDRDLLPSLTRARALELYESGYSVRGLYARLSEDAAHNPDTMDERRGGWGRLIALFRLIHGGHPSGFVRGRGGKLFDPEEYPFLEGRASKDDPPRILAVSDGCLLRILDGLMTLKLRGGTRERLSYRALDVEQIGSVYETVMGFTVEPARTRVLAIKAGKNNRTPVFVALDELLAKKAKERIRDLKESSGRGQLGAAQAKAVETAQSVDALAAALAGIIDERGSPHHAIAPAGTPILQPTDERRRTGSHYTPRSLTEPIVKYALEPAFERLGPEATPEQILELKVCDPAMGSGAFLVEACRAIGDRLVKAWDRWKRRRPAIPPDEDEQLHARRLVAQRCLYGVDKNPRAVDLARLSLWLATLASDHEFTFLDHALKCGDTLVGLSRAQLAALHWNVSKPGLPLFRQLIRDRIEEATTARTEIRDAPDDTLRAIQEARHRAIESRIAPVRAVGDAVIGAFFSADKPKPREKRRAEVESWLVGDSRPQWEKFQASAATLRRNELIPFHWELEFPEVFERASGGFDAIVGNPPFLGGTAISQNFGMSYFQYLVSLFVPAEHHCDLVAYFFRASFGLLCNGGCLGLVATNTIAQGDTREGGLAPILASGGSISRVIKRLRWPGDAAVIVSEVHVLKGVAPAPLLGERLVSRISAYLVEGNYDASPRPLVANPYFSLGSKIYGQGFLFDDKEALASPISLRDALLAEHPELSARIRPYLGGEELNVDPRQASSRDVIYLSDIETEDALVLVKPLAEIVRQRVLPERLKLGNNPNNKPLKRRWWAYQAHRPTLYKMIAQSNQVLCCSQVSPHMAFAFGPLNAVFAHTLVVIPHANLFMFAVLQSRVHELWARFFSSSMKDDLRYTPSDCFRTFPFPEGFESDATLGAIGDSYYVHRANLMIARDEGLTKTYNRFHARGEHGADIARLRALHGEMDAAALRAYGWDDLAARAVPEFIEQEADEGKTPKTRLDWPSEFKDEVLARLLALNAERAAAERARGLVPISKEDEEAEIDDDDESEEDVLA